MCFAVFECGFNWGMDYEIKNLIEGCNKWWNFVAGLEGEAPWCKQEVFLLSRTPVATLLNWVLRESKELVLWHLPFDQHAAPHVEEVHLFGLGGYAHFARGMMKKASRIEHEGLRGIRGCALSQRKEGRLLSLGCHSGRAERGAKKPDGRAVRLP